MKAGEGLDLALVWKVEAPPKEGAILFAGLFDGQGQRWAQADERPLGSLYGPPDWPKGEAVRTPLRLPVSPGTPPGRYRLEVGWYEFVDGQPVWLPWAGGHRLSLGEIEVLPPADWAALPLPDITYPVQVTMGEGIQFLGFEARTFEGQPGDSLSLDLYWQALEDGPEPGLAVLRVTDDAGTVLAEASSAPAGGQAPFARLVAGQTVRDPRQVTLPGDLVPGVYNLLLGRQRADGSWHPVRRGPFPLGSTYPLTTVRVRGQ